MARGLILGLLLASGCYPWVDADRYAKDNPTCLWHADEDDRPRPLDAEVQPDRDLLTRLGVAAFCTANLMGLVTAVYAGWWQGMHEAWADLFRWSILAFATPVALYSAKPFFDGAVRGLQAGVLHMDVPVSLAVAILYAHGLYATVAHQDGYLDSLAMLVTLLLVGARRRPPRRCHHRRGRTGGSGARTSWRVKALV